MTPCKRGHLAPKQTNGKCLECGREDRLRGNAVNSAYFARIKARRQQLIDKLAARAEARCG